MMAGQLNSVGSFVLGSKNGIWGCSTTIKNLTQENFGDKLVRGLLKFLGMLEIISHSTSSKKLNKGTLTKRGNGNQIDILCVRQKGNPREL